MKSRLWILATAHAMLGDHVFAPGEAVELDPDSPLHRAVVDAQAANQDPRGLLVVEHPSDPFAPAPPEPPEVSFTSTIDERPDDLVLEGRGRLRIAQDGLTGEALTERMAADGLRHDLKPPRWPAQQKAAEEDADAAEAYANVERRARALSTAQQTTDEAI